MTTRDEAAVAFLVGQGCDPELAHWTVHDASVPDENITALARAGGWRAGASLWDPPEFVKVRHPGKCLCHECRLITESIQRAHLDVTPYTTTADGRRRWKRER